MDSTPKPPRGTASANDVMVAANARYQKLCSSYFKTAKRNIITKLQEAIDFSPKGSLDAPVVELVNYINSLPDLVTTSSCSGRIAVYTWTPGRDPVSDDSEDAGEGAAAAPTSTSSSSSSSNKGAGKWQYVNHGELDPITASDLSSCLSQAWPGSSSYLKVEPLILHVQAASIEAARKLMGVCMAAGYRESGIGIGGGDREDHASSSLSLAGKEKIIVAVRTTACSLEVPLRHEGVDLAREPAYLEALARIANERFAEIVERRGKFERTLKRMAADNAAQWGWGQATAIISKAPSSAAATTGSVQCKDCGLSFTSKNAMFKTHLVDAAGSTKKVCPKPAATTIKGPTPTSGDTACATCGLSFPSRNKLFSHVKAAHPKGAAATKQPASSTSSSGPADEFGRALLPCDLEASRRANGASARLLKMVGWTEVRAAMSIATDADGNCNEASVTEIPGQIPEPGGKASKLKLDSGAGSGSLVTVVSGWDKVRHSADSFTIARHGHSATALDGCGLVLVFGGTSLASAPHGRTADPVVVDAKSGELIRPTIVADAPAGLPCPRTRHAAAAYPSSSSSSSHTVLLHGGHNGPLKQLDDLWLLTVERSAEGGDTLKASMPNILAPEGHRPAPRSGHSLCVVQASEASLLSFPFVKAALESAPGHKLSPCSAGGVSVGVLYGGRDASRSYSDTWLLLPVESETGSEGSQPSFVWAQVPHAGQADNCNPGRRYYHAAVASSSMVVVHGGYRSPYLYGEHGAASMGPAAMDGSDDGELESTLLGRAEQINVARLHGLRAQLRCDVCVFDLAAMTWRRLTRTVGDGDEYTFDNARMSHSLVPLPAPAPASASASSLSMLPFLLHGGHCLEPILVGEEVLWLELDNGGGSPSYSYRLDRLQPTRRDVVAVKRVRASHPNPRSIPWHMRGAVVALTPSPATGEVDLMALGGGGVVFAFGSHDSPTFRTTVTVTHKCKATNAAAGASEEASAGGRINCTPAVLAQLRARVAQWLKGAGEGVDDTRVLAAVPSKVEWVGNILVLPPLDASADALPPWAASEGFFKIVASHFNASRVARAAEIDPASKTRASQVKLLYPKQDAGAAPLFDLDDVEVLASCSGPGSQGAASDASSPFSSLTSPEALVQAEGWLKRVKKAVFQAANGTSVASSGGWVRVRESGVSYYFDITRTMFSSGNVNEKRRIGDIVGNPKGETVVDLFCGIGYWTVPLLTRARNISVVHACDWNPHAIACLRVNLAANAVDPKRYCIWPGDNLRLLERNPALEHQADRVLLGLIPTSEPWWPLALRLAKTKQQLAPGECAWLHVHENVTEARLESGEWAAHLVARLRGIEAELSPSQGKGSNGPLWSGIEVACVVRVKSFSPRVWHVVADVRLLA